MLNEKYNLVKLFRIVDISVERTFLQRLFGMSTLVLDTRVTNLDANLLPQGVYVTRTNIYTVNRNQVKVIKIEGDNYIPKGDYTDVFKSWLNWSAVIGGIAGIVILFVMYLILTLFYALCTQVIAKLARRDMAFDSRMRLSAVVLTASYILFIPLGWLGGSSTLLLLAVMLGALIWFVVKYVPTGKTAAAKAEVRQEDAAPAKIKAAPVKKAPAKKAPGKKKPAAKSETEKPAVPAKAEAKAAVKKPAAKKKPAVRKPAAKTAKAKPADKESK